jgi:predicted HNH restriction endonuclease
MGNARTPEARRAYYLANKEKWQKYAWDNLDKEKQKKLLEYQRDYRSANRNSISSKNKEKRIDRRTQAIKMLGGCCSACKGVFDSIVYDFHHLDPDKKEFAISEKALVSEERYFAEVEKCVLLCANCHRLEHKKGKNGA